MRPKEIYAKAHPEGAKNAALFRKFELSNTSFSALLRATALALNGVSPVEPNPQFGESTGFPACCLWSRGVSVLSCSRSLCLLHAVADLVAAAGKGSKIILACEAGGTLVPNASFQYGKESRSLKVRQSRYTEHHRFKHSIASLQNDMQACTETC